LKAAIQKPPSFNVSNLNYTGHSTELVSPAASAEDKTVKAPASARTKDIRPPFLPWQL